MQRSRLAHIWLWVFGIACLVASSVLVAPLAAQEQLAIQMEVEAGFDGQYRAGQWFPVTVIISNDGPDVQGVLEWHFPGQRESDVFQHEIDLPQGAQKQLTLSVFTDDFARTGELRLLVDGNEVREVRTQLEAIDRSEFVVGVVSSDPAFLNSLASMQIGQTNDTKVTHLDLERLPINATLLSGIDALFIHDSSTADLSAAQQEALTLWVELGGQLIVSGGANAEQTTSGLVELLPVTVGDLASNAPLDSLEQVVPRPRDLFESIAESTTVSEVDLKPDATALDDAELITVIPKGAGQVVFTAFDLSVLRGWTGEPRLWTSVLGINKQFTPATTGRWQGTSPIRNALQLPGVTLPSFGVIVAFILGYIVIVGPLNFLVLRRLRRADWAWLSVPAIVILFVVGTYTVSFAQRGTRVQIAQMTLVQSFENESRGQATAFLGVFSPQRDTYTLEFAPEALVSQERFNGMNQLTLLERDTSTEIEDVLVDVSALRTLIVEQPVAVDLQVESRLERDGTQITGTIRNNGSIPLEEPMLVQGDRMTPLDTLQPGAEQQVAFGPNAQNFPNLADASEEGLFNRQQVLTTLFSPNPFQPMGMNASQSGILDTEGMYLLGWHEEPAVNVVVDGQSGVQQGLTLYMIRLDG